MRNIRLRLQYEGTRYQGWQKQISTDNTIQGKMETLLSKMCGEPIEIAASGRTDAGVHALGQVANFHTESTMSTEEIRDYCNRYPPEDIAVVEVTEAAPRFHSRLNATGKRRDTVTVLSTARFPMCSGDGMHWKNRRNLTRRRCAGQHSCFWENMISRHLLLPERVRNPQSAGSMRSGLNARKI